MNSTEIIEGNKLIAEFMGAVTPKTAPEIILSYIKNDEVWYGDNTTPNGQYESAFKIFDLKYHSSWDWLMPVVDKITELSGKKQIDDKYALWMFITNDIESVWYKTIEFIKLDNKQNNK